MTQTAQQNFQTPHALFPLAVNRVLCAAIVLSLAGQTVPAFAQAIAPETAAPFAPTPATESPTVVVPMPLPSQVDATVTPPLTAASGSTSEAATAANNPVIVPSAPPTAAGKPLIIVYSRTGARENVMKEVMDDFRVVHASTTQKNVAGQVALNVALLLLGGGGMNFRTFDKEGLIGDSPEDLKDKNRLKNPAQSLLLEEVKRQTFDWLAANPKTSELKFSKPLVISSAAWRLVYTSLSSDDKTYQLKLDVEIYKRRDKASFFSDPVQVGKGCHFTSKAMPFDDWKANDYQAVADLRPVAVAQCAKEFTAQLPDLLELK